jgi:hypothetical protein
LHDLAELALWTPVALTVDPPALDWGDLRGVRFAEPFLDQTIDGWAGGDPAPLVRTGFDTLEALEALGAPSLDPALLIFHLSRCGSTLLSRLLAALPGVLVVAEPAPVNALLAAPAEQSDEAARVDLLRLLVRALARRRFGDERHCVLKLSSWNIRHVGLFRRAFPGVPIVWVQRDPAAIMASLLAKPTGWQRLQHRPHEAQVLFGDEAVRAGADTKAFIAAALAALLRAAAEARPDLVVDYAELPHAAWERVAPLLGLAVTTDDTARLRLEAGYYAKDRGRRPFAGDPPERLALRDSLAPLAAETVVPLYRAVAARG